MISVDVVQLFWFSPFKHHPGVLIYITNPLTNLLLLEPIQLILQDVVSSQHLSVPLSVGYFS